MAETYREAQEECRDAGRRFCARVLGILDRETGKLTDQFSILKGHEEEVSEIVTNNFLDELDIAMEQRGFSLQRKEE